MLLLVCLEVDPEQKQYSNYTSASSFRSFCFLIFWKYWKRGLLCPFFPQGHRKHLLDGKYNLIICLRVWVELRKGSFKSWLKRKWGQLVYLPHLNPLLLLCCPSSNFERQTWLFTLLLKTPQWLILMPSFTSVHLTACASSYPELLAVTCAISQVCTFFLFFSGLTCHPVLLLIRNTHSPSGLSSRNFLSLVKLLVPLYLPSSNWPFPSFCPSVNRSYNMCHTWLQNYLTC